MQEVRAEACLVDPWFAVSSCLILKGFGSLNRGPFWRPYNEDHGTLGSVFGPPMFGNSHLEEICAKHDLGYNGMLVQQVSSRVLHDSAEDSAYSIGHARRLVTW